MWKLWLKIEPHVYEYTTREWLRWNVDSGSNSSASTSLSSWSKGRPFFSKALLGAQSCFPGLIQQSSEMFPFQSFLTFSQNKKHIFESLAWYHLMAPTNSRVIGMYMPMYGPVLYVGREMVFKPFPNQPSIFVPPVTKSPCTLPFSWLCLLSHYVTPIMCLAHHGHSIEGLKLNSPFSPTFRLLSLKTEWNSESTRAPPNSRQDWYEG